MKKITRRKFIKISAAGTATVAMSGIILDAAPKIAEFLDKEPAKESEVERTPTYCEVCFWKCAAWVYKDKRGKIQKIIGNEKDPNSRGRLCPRGTGGVGFYYDNDRLKNPMIRVKNKKGDQFFKEVSWDEALDYTVKRLTEIKDKYGPEKIALFTHGSSGRFWSHMLKSLGSVSVAAPSYAQCRGPREVAFIATFGSGVSSPEPTDIENSKCLVLIGSHIGENMHNQQVQEMSKLIENGGSIITVDPRFSTAASKSKYWLPIKPATDMALLLAWINIIISENLYDKSYVEKYTYGFEQLKSHIKKYTPEWAAKETELDVNLIKKTAYEMAKASPAVIVHPGRHVTWYGDDTQRLRAVAILNALLGSWGRRGGFYIPAKAKVAHFPHAEYPKPKKTWRDILGDKYKLAGLALSSGICDATIPDDTGQMAYKAWIVNGTNLIKTLPDLKNTLKAIDNLEFIAVSDIYPSEITGYADVILPECSYLERWDLPRISQNRYPTIALRMPAAEPRFNSKPGWWIAKEIGHRMGLKSCYHFDDITELIDWQLKKLGTSIEEMKKIGVKVLDRQDSLYIQPNEDYFFNTNTGKIELYSTELASEGFDPMPVYTRHKQPSTGYYRLIYGRAPMHTFSRTQNNPNLNDLMDENNLWINPKIAKINGFTEGQEVWLKNQDGIVSTFSIKIRITERIRPDSVYMVHGFGHTQKHLTRAYGKGASDSEMITNIKYDPIMGGTGMRENFVTILTKKPQKKEVKS